MQIFLTKRKIDNWGIYGQAYIYLVWYFGEKESLQRNGMATILKITGKEIFLNHNQYFLGLLENICWIVFFWQAKTFAEMYFLTQT